MISVTCKKSHRLNEMIFQTNEKLIEHLWAPNLHFLTTERFSSLLWCTLDLQHQIGADINSEECRHSHNIQEWFSTLRQPHKTHCWSVDLPADQMSENYKLASGTCFMSFTNYPLDEQLCRVLSVSHSNSIHEVGGKMNLVYWKLNCLGCTPRFNIVQHRVSTASSVQTRA